MALVYASGSQKYSSTGKMPSHAYCRTPGHAPAAKEGKLVHQRTRTCSCHQCASVLDSSRHRACSHQQNRLINASLCIQTPTWPCDWRAKLLLTQRLDVTLDTLHAGKRLAVDAILSAEDYHIQISKSAAAAQQSNYVAKLVIFAQEWDRLFSKAAM